MKRNLVLTGTAAGACLVALIATLLTWPSSPGSVMADRSRQYGDARACMLTGAGGVSDPVAAAAWAGMQGASSSTRAMISYLSVPAPATRASAQPYVASLVQRQCGVIVAVGQAQTAAAWSAATASGGGTTGGRVHFIVVTAGPAGPVRASVVRIFPAPAASVRTAVQAAVVAALNN